MRNGFFPLFTKGRVLKKESVEYLRDFPYDMASLAYEGYSDGILSGFSIRSSGDEECIHVSRGALKYHGDIIAVPESTVGMAEYGESLYVVLTIGKCRETLDSKVRSIDLRAARGEPRADDEVELGRFCLNSGAILRTEYDSFSDLRTPENTLDITRAPYAGYGAPTLHPTVLKTFAQAVMAYSQEPADLAFAMTCLNTGVVHKGSIQWYIAKKADRPYEEFSLAALYEKLEELLPQGGVKRRERPRGRGPVIV